MSNTPSTLSRNECAALKGVGILMIMLHNLCHTMPFIKNLGIDGNEYYFEAASARYLQGYLAAPDASALLTWMALLGYCGIHIFLFASAFGLVRKYEQSPLAPQPSALKFIGGHYAKLWKLMIIGLLLTHIVYFCHEGEWVRDLPNFVKQLLMVSNIAERPYTCVWPGPYWFLGLMVQLYIIYRLVLHVPPHGAKWRKWALPVAFAVACCVPQTLVAPHGKAIIIMRYNFLTAGLSFAAGLLVARYNLISHHSRTAWAVIGLMAFAAYHAMQFSFGLWLVSPLVLLAAMVAMVKASRHLRAMEWVGGLSAYIFIVHPIVRIPVREYIFAHHITGMLALHVALITYAALSILAALLYRRLLQSLHQ